MSATPVVISPGYLLQTKNDQLSSALVAERQPSDDLISSAGVSQILLKGQVAVCRSYLHLTCTSVYTARHVSIRRARAVRHVVTSHDTAVKYVCTPECQSETIGPRLSKPTRAVRSLASRVRCAAVSVEYRAEEGVEVWRGMTGASEQRKPLLQDTNIYYHTAVHREHTTTHINKQVKVLLAVIKYLPLVSEYKRKLRSALRRDWCTDQATNPVSQTKIVNDKMTQFAPHHTADCKPLMMSCGRKLPYGHQAYTKATVVEIAGNTKILLPYPLPHCANDYIIKESLGDILDAANLQEPFYMRHMYGRGKQPDRVMIIPKSMVEKSMTGKLHNHQVTAGPAGTKASQTARTQDGCQCLGPDKRLRSLECEYSNELKRLQEEMKAYLHLLDTANPQCTLHQFM